MHKLAENYTAISLIKPKSITGTETGTGVTVTGYEDDIMVVMDFGAMGGTTETFIATVESSVIGDFTDAVVQLTFGTVTGSNGDNKIAAGGFKRPRTATKIRGIVTMSGSTASLVGMTALCRAQIGQASANSLTPA